MHLNEKAKYTGKLWIRLLTAGGTILLGSVLGLVTMIDYYHAGILMTLVFYFFRGRKLWQYLGQFLGLLYVNFEVLGGLAYPVTWLGFYFEFPQQGFAVFSLLLIWLYRGKQGFHNKMWQYICYAFYPAHMLILGLLMLWK